MRSVKCVIISLMLTTLSVYGQTCDEISLKIDEISKKLNKDHENLSNFQNHADTEIAKLKSDNNECFSKLITSHAQFIKQLGYMNQWINSSRTNIDYNNVINVSKLVEIVKFHSPKIIELNETTTYLNHIIRYFDVKFRILERRAKLKENDENYQKKFQALKSQMKSMQIMMIAIFGVFLALKLMIICKWCCCMRFRLTKKDKVEEIEMKYTAKPNKHPQSKHPEASVAYVNIDYDTNKAASIGKRKYSNQFQNVSIGTIPKVTSNLKTVKDDDYYSKSADEFYNDAENDDQIYDTCEHDDSKGNTLSKQKVQQDLNNFDFPPPPNDFLYSKNLDEEIYYDEFYDGLTDDTETIYDNVARESTGVLSRVSRIPVLVKFKKSRTGISHGYGTT
ncbi:hypothetical protein ACKWTF_016236 [Chironomus riparius]